nr:helix-turn-helix domain-containing protein [uncultured Pseudodesulfovibrio sp.]
MQSQDGIGKRFSPYKQFRRVSVIPNTLMRYIGLSHGAKLVWARLAQYAGADGRAYPAVGTLAQEVGLKKRQTQNLLAELKAEGFIESELGPKANAYYFLLHPALVEEGVQNGASGDAESCPVTMQDDAPRDAKTCSTPAQNDAPKETKEENYKEKTTTQSGGCRVSFSDLSEEKQRYIELKTKLEQQRGRIRSSVAAYKAGLVQLAAVGALDTSGLKELECAHAVGGSVSRNTMSAHNNGQMLATPDRIQQYLRFDGRSPEEISILLQNGGDSDEKFWGLPSYQVAQCMRELFPEFWR